LRVVGDGGGGWYVLWIDNRIATDRYAVFGTDQQQGIPQWSRTAA
jgi:hypothetical protein